MKAKIRFYTLADGEISATIYFNKIKFNLHQIEWNLFNGGNIRFDLNCPALGIESYCPQWIDTKGIFPFHNGWVTYWQWIKFDENRHTSVVKNIVIGDIKFLSDLMPSKKTYRKIIRKIFNSKEFIEIFQKEITSSKLKLEKKINKHKKEIIELEKQLDTILS